MEPNPPSSQTDDVSDKTAPNDAHAATEAQPVKKKKKGKNKNIKKKCSIM